MVYILFVLNLPQISDYMRKLLLGTVIFCGAFFNTIKAQQVVQKDTLNNTPLTISMDRSISDIMENMEERCATAMVTREADESSSRPVSTRPTTVRVANRALTNAEICRQNPKIMGFKIQLTVVKSNAEANEVKEYFRRRFPYIKVQTDASLRPNYKILAGSYFTKQSAQADLSRIKKYFQSAIPVQYSIFCVEAK